MAEAAEKSRADKRYDKSAKVRKVDESKPDKDTPKVADKSDAEQSAEANGEGAAAAGAPSAANLEDVMDRHSRERGEMMKGHGKMVEDMMKRHSDELAGLIGGTGEKAEG